MFTKNLLKSGWLHALFIAMFAYPITSMTLKIVSSYTETNILVYTTFMMLSCSASLLIISGPGELSIRTLKRPETWVYAILQIFSYVLLLLSFKYISATEGAALGKMGGLFVFILSILFLNQKANIYENLGAFIVFLGFYFIIYSAPLPIDAKAMLTIIVSARALVQCGQKMIAEVHKTNRKAKNFKSQIRVTGFIMAISSFVFLIFLLSIAYVKNDNTITLFNSMPNLKDFLNFNALILGIFLGALIISSAKYCEFYAGKTIGSKYLTSISSLELIFIFILEFSLSKFNLIEARDISSSTLIALTCVFGGSIIISLAGFINNLKFIKKGEIQDTLENLDENFLENKEDFKIVKLNLANLFSLYDSNSDKLAKDIKIDQITLENILNYKFEDVKIKRKTAKKINNFASKNVSLKDKLTKAYNRYSLTYKVNDLFKQKQEFKLYLLDLNKFKPINDKFGHEAGDIVLIKIVNRLKEIAEFSDSVFRLGGDEFVLIQTENLEKDLSEEISDKIKEPIIYEDNKLEVSTSIGFAESKDFKDLEGILALADKKMYKNKSNK